MRKFGLAAILTFVDKGATAAMGKIGAAAKKLQKRFRGIGAGVQQLGRGFGTLATAALPLTGVLGLVIKKGAQFEQAIANLRSKMIGKFDPALKGFAKTLGTTTVFSATQAANAMTELAKANFKVNQITAAIPGVLAAAAAEGIPLAQAASIVADTLNQFKISADQSGAAANTLALASISANTNISGLAEGLKLAAPIVKQVGGNFTDTVAILGALADVGLKGTTAGTALRAGLSNLIDPNKKAKKAISALGLSLKFVAKKFKEGDVAGLLKEFSQRLSKIKDGGKRARLALRLFGKRAVPLAGALAKTADGTDRFGKTLKKLSAEFKSGGSAAEKMAKIQLGTLIGQGKLASSAIEGISIELFKMISGETRSLAEGLVKTLSDLALAMRQIGGEEITDPKAKKQLEGISSTIFSVARGIREGVGEAKAALKGIFSTLGSVAKRFGLAFGGKGGPKAIAKMVTKFVALAAVLAPVALGFLAITKVAGGMKDVVVGGLKVAIGVGKTAGTVLGGVASVLGKRIPVLGKIFGGIGGVVGKAARAAEKAVAQPVRVVNFDEIGGLGGAAAGAGGFIGPIQQLPSLFSSFRTSLNSLTGRIPFIGKTLSSSLSGIARGSGSLVGKLGTFGAAIGAAGVAGFAFGTFLDKQFGLSDKISKAAATREADIRNAIVGPLKKQQVSLEQTVRSMRTLNQLVALQKRGITTVGVGGGKRAEITRKFAQERIIAGLRRDKTISEKEIATQLARLAPILAKLPIAAAKPAAVTKPKPAKDALVSSSGILAVSPGDVVLDRASLAGAVVSQIRGGLRGQAGQGALGGGSPGQTSPAPASGGQTFRIEVPVSIDGRQIALAVASVKLEDLERSGATLKAGDRSALLQRGFREEV